MARKILFEVAPESKSALEVTGDAVSRAPALSGMAKSLHAATSASVRDIALELIEDSPHSDRLGLDEDEIAELAESIRKHGQLVPILVSPVAGGRFRIVYGRRRLSALRRLGQPAKALIRDLDDDQAIIAQGQENTFRKDLSWIEKAVFAKQLIEDGKAENLVCDALNIDQKARSDSNKLTNLSRMKQVTLRISPELIQAVGPAPRFGRDRWYALARSLDANGFPAGNQGDLVKEIEAVSGTSDERFVALEKAVRSLSPRTNIHLPHQPDTFGKVKATNRQVTITILAQDAKDLHAWIRDNPQEALDALVEAQSKTKP